MRGSEEVLLKLEAPEIFRNGPKPVVTALSVALSSAPAMVMVVGLVRLPPKRLRSPPPEVEEEEEDEEKVPVTITIPCKSFSVVLELELLVLVFRPVSGLLLSWMRGVVPVPVKSAPPESFTKPTSKEPPVVMGLSMALRS